MDGRNIAQLTVIACGTLALAAVAQAGPRQDKVPLPRPRPMLHQPVQQFTQAPLAILPSAFVATPAPTAALAYTRTDLPMPASPTVTTPASDIDLVKRAADLVRRDRFSDASALKSSIRDPLARKLVEWMILRGDQNHSPGFERYAAFVAENPSWPSVGLLRSRAEAALWDNKREPDVVIAYFANNTPRTAKGGFALGRALVARGDKARAEPYVREAWRNEPFSSAVEQMALDLFAGMLKPEDHRARMHQRLYAEDNDGGLRSAQRLGGDDWAIAKAWAAVNRGSKQAKALLDAVPEGARHDPGYIFSQTRWLRRHDKISEAAQVLLNGSTDPSKVYDPDDWWIEHRQVTRYLIEAGQYQTAYAVARHAPPPNKGNYRVDREFMAGWVALRFLKDPATAVQHFTAIANLTRNPTALARAGYWLGRAADARGESAEARSHYASAAQFRTTYYGQLARARLGEADIALPPAPSHREPLSRLEVVRALGLLYAAGQRDLAIPFVADMASRTGDVGALTALAEVTLQNRDARATMLIGKAALNQGLTEFAHYAFPTIGVPQYKPIGPEVHPSLLYSIVRQESGFNPETVSSAKAMGLMQVTAEAGRYIARKFKVGYNAKRLLKDSVYNVQMGSAELGDLVRDYGGSYILAFVGYNAGRGRVRDWIARFGDPRDPKVDPVDWVEMIPFAETRNYVQRILENVQVYRARFGATRQLLIEADLRRGSTKN